MKFQLKRLGKEALIYGIGGGIGKMFPFLMLPFYTRVFSPQQYGIIDLMDTILSFSGIFLAMGTDAARSYLFYNRFGDSEESRGRLISAIAQWRMLWSFLLIMLVVVFQTLINKYFFNNEVNVYLIVVAFIGLTFLQFQNQASEIFRLLHEAFNYLSITMVQTILFSGLAVIFILTFKNDISNYYYAYTSAAVITACWGAWKVRRFLNFSKLHTDIWPIVLKMSLPLVPMGLLIVVLNLTDRWCIKYFLGLDYLGVYALGSKVALVTTFISTAFRTAWWPLAMEALNKKEFDLIKTVGELFLGLGMALVILISILAPFVVSLISPSAYVESYQAVGFLSLTGIFFGFVQISQLGIFKSERTGIITILVLVAAGINLILNLLLISKYGIAGASFSTMLSMGIRNALSLLVSERRVRIGFDMGLMTVQFLLTVFVICLLIYFSYNVLSVGIAVIVMLVVLTTTMKKYFPYIKRRVRLS